MRQRACNSAKINALDFWGNASSPSRMRQDASRFYQRVMDVNCLVRSCTYLKKAQMSRLPPPYVSLYSVYPYFFLNNLKYIPFINKKDIYIGHLGFSKLNVCFNLIKSVHDAPRIVWTRPGRNAAHLILRRTTQNANKTHFISKTEIVKNNDCTIAIKTCTIINRHNVSKG